MGPPEWNSSPDLTHLRSCGNGISLKHKTWSLSPSVQSVSVMKATLLVLLLSAVAVMLSCDHQHSEREAGPGCPLGKRLAFDVNTTVEESKRLNNEYFDCPNPEPGAPCFYYSHVFYPFFVIEDTVVGESDRFHDRETAGSPFCEYTVRFELHVHGFPLDPVRALFFHQMTMTVVQTILICYIGHTCWRLKRKTVYTKTRDGLDEQEGHEQFNAGDVGVKVGCTLRSCCLHLYHIIFGIVQNPVLDHVILLVVLLDTSTLMAHTFQSVTVTTSWCLSAVNSCLLVFYVLEALLKILIQGRTYFRNPWNDLDFFIVLMTLLDFVLSLVQSGGGFSSRQASTLFRVLKTLKGARVFRALRLLKAIRFFKGLQDILLTCLQSFRSMSSILVLMFLFLFIFAVVFREMFNESDPEHFGSIFRTVFTLFQILTLDDWSLIYMTSRDNGAPHIIYFMSLYILVELFTFLNLFIAVLVDNFQLSIRKKRHHKSQKSPDVKEGEAQSTKKAGEDLDVSLAEIEEEFYKEALRHASSDGKHSKRPPALTRGGWVPPNGIPALI
ncbi:hypothetical protein SRHO_G00344860 [Serrasalmus rhombeus]